MIGKEKLFRKAALERLSSPEQLDMLMQVTNPYSWLALIGLIAIVLTAIFWSIFGSIPTKIAGQGILIRTGGIFEVVSLGSGRVTEVRVSPGDVVKKGQIVALVAQPELLDQVNSAKAQLAEAEIQHATLSSFLGKDLTYQRDILAQRRTTDEQKIRDSQESVKWYEERIAVEEDLLKSGLIIEKQVHATKSDLAKVKDEILRAQAELKEIKGRELALANDAQQQGFASQLKIADAQRRISQLENQMNLNSGVVSSLEGRVLEIRTDVGKVVTVGTPLISLESLNANVEALFYVPPADGKKIHDGMEAHISPTTVKKEEYGLILGRVTSISSFPATTQAMMRALGNEELVRSLSASGSPFEVRAELTPDPQTESGYRWTSGKGPPLRIYSGTLCVGMATVRKQRPLALVIPYVREKLGV